MTVKIKVKDKLEDDTLDLSWCDLKEVPIKEIAPIKKASFLDLSNNQLVSIPKTIVSLTHIVRLDLSKNLLTEIPENIGEMRHLKYLDLYSNKISRLPLSMGDLKNLKWLDLKDNPLTPAVASVAGPCSNTTECQQCARSIVSYLTYISRTIEDEKKRRTEASAAAPAASSKKESKKKKKKTTPKDEKQNAKEADVQQSASHEDAVDHIAKANGHDKVQRHESCTGGVCGSLCRLMYSTITLTIFLGILSILTMILLPRVNQPLSDKLVNYLQEQTRLPVREYQTLGIKKFDASTNTVISFLNHTKTLASETFAKIIGQQHKCCGN